MFNNVVRIKLSNNFVIRWPMIASYKCSVGSFEERKITLEQRSNQWKLLSAQNCFSETRWSNDEGVEMTTEILWSLRMLTSLCNCLKVIFGRGGSLHTICNRETDSSSHTISSRVRSRRIDLCSYECCWEYGAVEHIYSGKIAVIKFIAIKVI